MQVFKNKPGRRRSDAGAKPRGAGIKDLSASMSSIAYSSSVDENNSLTTTDHYDQSERTTGSFRYNNINRRWSGSTDDASYMHSSWRNSNPLDTHSSEFRSQLVETNSEAKHRRSRRRSDIKLATLRHDKIGYYGRDVEIAQLQACVDRLANTGFSGSWTVVDDDDLPEKESGERMATNAFASETFYDGLMERSDRDIAATTNSSSNHSRRKTELVLISGFSGTGKSALSQKIKMPPGSAYCVGKCDGNVREEPYSSIADACESLCQHILEEQIQHNQEQDISSNNESQEEDEEDNQQDNDGISVAAKVRNLLSDQLNDEIIGYLCDLIPSLRALVNDAMNRSSKQATRTIPETLSIPINHDAAPSLNAEAKRQQINHSFRVLIRVFSSSYKPLIICLDDLQWADTSTLELIEMLLTDPENAQHNRLLMVGCYRSNYADDSNHNGKFSSILARLYGLDSSSNLSSREGERQQTATPTSSNTEGGSPVNVTEIVLSNLSIEDCNSILMDMLSNLHHEDPHLFQPLATICHKRTLGNVHFLIQFIVMLKETQLLDFHLGLMEWKWADMHVIEAQTSAADNVLAVVEQRMAQLDEELQHFLSIAASIGATATFRILDLAWTTVTSNSKTDQTKSNKDGHEKGVDSKDAMTCIDESVAGNFLESYGEDKYKFVHDKIQEAAGKLMPQDERKREEFDIGMNMINKFTEDEKYSDIFLIRDLLDSKENPTDEESETLIRINLLASQRARSFSAFQSSLTYAKKGLSMLQDNNKAWEGSYYDTTLQLYCLACEAAEFTAQSALLEQLSNEVLTRTDCPLLEGKLQVYKVKMDGMANDGDPESLKKAIHLLIDLLKKLQCKVPRGPSVPVSVISSILRFKRDVPTEGGLRALPKLVDKEKGECMFLLYRLQGYAYFQRHFLLSTWAALKIATMTLEHGRHVISSTAFPAIGMAMTGLFGEFQKGELYAKLGELLVDMEDNKEKEGRTSFTTTASYSYVQPVQSAAKRLRRGYKTAMQAGDTER